MSENKKPKKARVAQAIKNTRILSKVASGMTVTDVAKDEDMDRKHVSDIVNHSPEAKALERVIAKSFRELVSKSMKTFDRVVSRSDPQSDGTALRAAEKIIERVVGKVPDKVEVSGEFEGKSRQELIAIIELELKHEREATSMTPSKEGELDF